MYSVNQTKPVPQVAQCNNFLINISLKLLLLPRALKLSNYLTIIALLCTFHITIAQNFISQWSFPEPTTQIRFNAQTVGDVNYSWSASPSGNTGNGNFNRASAGAVVLENLVLASGDMVTLSIEPDNLRRFYINQGPDRTHLIDITQWDAVPWSSMNSMFYGCTALQITATDAPDLSNATDLSLMFTSANSFNSNIGHWDISNITSTVNMFSGATAFNQDIGSWNTANVTNMRQMFRNAQAFNQDIGNWDTSNVINMNFLFHSANSFNQNIGNWDVSKVTEMDRLFYFATAFNQDIGNWDVSNVTAMLAMFSGAASFNQDIGSWDVSKVRFMGAMFSDAHSFNQDLNSWDVSEVQDLSAMFRNASSFNQNIGNWLFRNNANMGQMLDNSGIDCHNYSATLIGWQANNSDLFNRSLGALGMQYEPAATFARDLLTNNQGWSINGDIAISPSCVEILSIDAAATSHDKGLKVHPIPAETVITVTGDAWELQTLKLYSITGQDITSKTEVHVTETSVIMNISQLNAGFYVLKTKSQSNIIIRQ